MSHRGYTELELDLQMDVENPMPMVKPETSASTACQLSNWLKNNLPRVHLNLLETSTQLAADEPFISQPQKSKPRDRHSMAPRAGWAATLLSLVYSGFNNLKVWETS